MIRAKAWLVPIKNAPRGSYFAERCGNRIVPNGRWARPPGYRDRGAWRSYARWGFWKPWARIWGLRAGLVVAWGLVPPDWFERS